MAHYNIIYTCGHTDRVNLVGPHRWRAAAIDRMERGACFECYKTEKHQAAREQAETMDLPPLAGSEKQVPWAETLRVATLGKIEEELATLEAEADPDRVRTPAELDAERQVLHAIAVITAETSAKWWIDHRYDSVSQIIREVVRAEIQKPTAAEQEARRAAADKAATDKALVLAEATVRPEQTITDTVAEIVIAGKVVRIHFAEKRDDFRAVVKRLGYSWENGCWQRTIGKFAGTPADRAAEAGHTLLIAGFGICILDDALRAAAVAGTYTPECTRWVQKVVGGEHVGWFALVWARGDNVYDAARRITGSRYSAPQVVVPPEQFAQVLDFAARYQFQFSDGAQEIVTLARTAHDAALVVQPAPKRRVTLPQSPTDGKPPHLGVPESVDIAHELQDD